MPIGICKLCLQNRDLQDSHLLPKALYRMSRFEGAPNPNPALLTPDGIVQTSKQIKDYLLCKSCEELFSKNGERYALSQVNRDGNFALLRTLRANAPKSSLLGFTYYDGAAIPSINKVKLAYFAVSVFWRAGVHVWQPRKLPTPMIDLIQYKEPIRQYLLGLAPFPKNMAILLYVCSDMFSQRVFYEPSSGNPNDKTTWTFQVRGLNFFLAGNDEKASDLTSACLLNGARQVISVRNCEGKIFEGVKNILQKSAAKQAVRKK